MSNKVLILVLVIAKYYILRVLSLVISPCLYDVFSLFIQTGSNHLKQTMAVSYLHSVMRLHVLLRAATKGRVCMTYGGQVERLPPPVASLKQLYSLIIIISN